MWNDLLGDGEAPDPMVWVILVAAVIGFIFFISVYSLAEAAPACAYETEEARITDQLNEDPGRPHFTIEDDALDRFIKNANELWNIGWQRKDFDKIWIIDQRLAPQNPHFQGVHMFMMKNHCIVYYQTTFKDIVKLLLLDDPMKVLRGDQ